MEPANSNPMSNVRQLLEGHFNASELRTLSFDLNIDYENLAGLTKEEKFVSLLDYCKRYGRLPDLISLCKVRRSFVNWPVVEPASTEQDEISHAILTQPLSTPINDEINIASFGLSSTEHDEVMQEVTTQSSPLPKDNEKLLPSSVEGTLESHNGLLDAINSLLSRKKALLILSVFVGVLAVLFLLYRLVLIPCCMGDKTALIIDSHQDGDAVLRVEEMYGSYENFGPGWHIWGIVEEDEFFWLTDYRATEGEDGEWSLPAYFGLDLSVR